jgi:hypothetical protein
MRRALVIWNIRHAAAAPSCFFVLDLTLTLVGFRGRRCQIHQKEPSVVNVRRKINEEIPGAAVDASPPKLSVHRAVYWQTVFQRRCPHPFKHGMGGGSLALSLGEGVEKN